MPRIRAASIDEHKELTRASLLEAAHRIIGESGTAEIPLGEIALGAGVGRTTFYDYFDGRDDVIAALVEEKLPGVITGMIDAVPANLSTSERLTWLAARTVEFVATDPVFGVILHREAGWMSLEAQQRIGDAHAALAIELGGIYRAGVAEGVFRAMPGYLAGRLIQDTIMSAARVLIEDGSRRDELTEEVGVFLLGGLGNVGQPRP